MGLLVVAIAMGRITTDDGLWRIPKDKAAATMSTTVRIPTKRQAGERGGGVGEESED